MKALMIIAGIIAILLIAVMISFAIQRNWLEMFLLSLFLTLLIAFIAAIFVGETRALVLIPVCIIALGIKGYLDGYLMWNTTWGWVFAAAEAVVYIVIQVLVLSRGGSTVGHGSSNGNHSGDYYALHR